MAEGVPAGATSANHPTMSKPGSVSDRAGTESKSAMRFADVTASGRRRPDLISCVVAGRSATTASTCPPTVSWTATLTDA